MLFGFGALISIFFLSIGPENRLKKTFYAYIDYFNINKRVIYHHYSDSTHFTAKSECQLVYYSLDKSTLLNVLDGGKVNFSKSEKDKEPCQIYMIENIINAKNFEVLFEYCYSKEKVTVLSVNEIGNEEVCLN